MKRMSVIISVVLLFALTAFPVFAATSGSEGKVIVLSRGETVNGNYFNAGNTVTISGTVHGDAMVAGGQVLVDGIVDGDLFVAGGTIRVTGKVTHSIRAVGGDITISGEVGRNISTVGGTTVIENGTKIKGSVVSVGGDTNILAPVTKEIDAAAGQLTIGNHVGGGIKAAVGQLTFAPNASVAGAVSYWSDKEADVQGGAQLPTEVHRYAPLVKPDQEAGRRFIHGVSVGAKIIGFLSSLIIGLLILFLFPNFSKSTAEIVVKRVWPSLGWGFLVTILMPVAFVILLITIIGIPYAFILLGLFILLAYFAKIFVLLAIGEQIMRYTKSKVSPLWVFVFGLLIYEILKFIPIIGGIVSLAVFFIGIGALLLEKRQLYTKLRHEKLL